MIRVQLVDDDPMVRAGVRGDLAAYGGAAYLSPQIAHRVIQQVTGQAGRRTAAADRIAVLTPREREVLALVGAGLSNAEIARQLYLVEGTVKAYVSAVLSRLPIRRGQLVVRRTDGLFSVTARLPLDAHRSPVEGVPPATARTTGW